MMAATVSAPPITPHPVTGGRSGAGAAPVDADELFRNVTPRDAEDAKYRQIQEQQKVDLSVRLICQHCRDPVPNIIEDFKQGDLICGSCGTVFKDRIIDTRSEWRSFSSDEGGDDPSRVGSAENKLFSGRMNLETAIGMRDGGKGTAKELAKTHSKQSAVRNERMLLQAFRDISVLGERMGLPRTVIDAGKQYFKLAEDKQLINKTKLEIVCAVCLFLGCRKSQITRTFQEFAEMVGTTRHGFFRVFDMINREIAQLSNINPEDHAGRICNSLGMKPNAAQYVTKVCINARKLTGMASRTPGTVVGAAIYLVSHLLEDKRSAKAIAQMVKVTEGTIRQAYRILRDHITQVLAGTKLENANIDLLPAS